MNYFQPQTIEAENNAISHLPITSFNKYLVPNFALLIFEYNIALHVVILVAQNKYFEITNGVFFF